MATLAPHAPVQRFAAGPLTRGPIAIQPHRSPRSPVVPTTLSPTRLGPCPDQHPAPADTRSGRPARGYIGNPSTDPALEVQSAAAMIRPGPGMKVAASSHALMARGLQLRPGAAILGMQRARRTYVGPKSTHAQLWPNEFERVERSTASVQASVAAVGEIHGLRRPRPPTRQGQLSNRWGLLRQTRASDRLLLMAMTCQRKTHNGIEL